MTIKYYYTSLTRISNLPEVSFSVEALPRDEWETGDYVVGEVGTSQSNPAPIEQANGRMVEVIGGDLVVGAFGKRYATLESVGDWWEIGEDLQMSALTAAGLFGKVTSGGTTLLSLTYKGHALVDGEKVAMRDFVPSSPERPLEVPVVLLLGTSMSAGKTTSGKAIVRLLEQAGLKVVGAKLAGAARYSDLLGLQDAGADLIFDFVDAGLPSTAVPEDEYRRALRGLLARIAEADADVVVAEVGASPMEPYNGEVAIEVVGPNVRCTVLSATDPYAVAGMLEAFDFKNNPDLVTGRATRTTAGVEMVEKLSGIKALNVMDRDALPELQGILKDALDL
jgi:hypothetical protein